ncbi:MAG: metal-dependent transcriptional regulator [Anaerolineaceae bacterium]
MKSESRSEQDYLKIIFDEIERSGEATTSRLANRLSVAPASVTGMFKKLADQEPPLIIYKKHRGAVLTPEGRKVALEMIRHHRLIELFLMKVLGFGWDEVHEEADRLEHVLSDAMEERIAALLGNPTLDPHGAQIPDESLVMEPLPIVRLSSLRIGQKAIIRSVPDYDPDLLRYLARQSLTPREEVTVLDCSPVDRNLTLQITSGIKKTILGQAAAGNIYVEIIP